MVSDVTGKILSDMMQEIFRNEKMRNYWKMYQSILDNDKDHLFSPMERLQILVLGSLQLDLVNEIGNLDAEAKKEALDNPSTVYTKLERVQKQISELEEKAKIRAEKNVTLPKEKSPFDDADRVEIEKGNEKITFTREKKEGSGFEDLE